MQELGEDSNFQHQKNWSLTTPVNVYETYALEWPIINKDGRMLS